MTAPCGRLTWRVAWRTSASHDGEAEGQRQTARKMLECSMPRAGARTGTHDAAAMTANEPRPNEEMGRVLPFQRRERARPPAPEPRDESPVANLEKYAQDNAPDDYRQRMINKGLALLACILLVAAGIWVANTMAEMRRNQDCVLSGRRNCTPIPAPSAGPTK